MSTISGVGGSGDAWAQMRSQMQARMFKKADSSGDGSVDKAELKAVLADVSTKTGKTVGGNVDDTFASMDGNSDGKLSSDELGKGMQSLVPPPSTMDFAKSTGAQGSTGGGDPIDAMFSKIDGNSDGSLDKTELKSLADKIKADTGIDVSGKLEKLADDNGGTVSKDQFKAALEKERPSGPPEGAGGPPGAGGPSGAGGAGGAGGSQSSTSKTYDKLDTNQDGVVSELERLVGELKSAAASKGGDANAASDKSSENSASFDVSQLVKKMYEQFSGALLADQATHSFSAVA